MKKFLALALVSRSPGRGSGAAVRGSGCQAGRGPEGRSGRRPGPEGRRRPEDGLDDHQEEVPQEVHPQDDDDHGQAGRRPQAVRSGFRLLPDLELRGAPDLRRAVFFGPLPGRAGLC